MTFRVGQKVVCVDAVGSDADGVAELVEGHIYVVRWEGVHKHPYFPSKYCIRVDGIVRTEPTHYGQTINPDCPFRASRFRPIVESKTDISIFTAMLTPKKVRA